jgi:predicted site-specific integrase-resolvase
MLPTLLDARQLATELDTSYDEVLSWTRRGLIPVIKAGGRYYYNLSKVAKALHAQAAPTTEGEPTREELAQCP